MTAQSRSSPWIETHLALLPSHSVFLEYLADARREWLETEKPSGPETISPLAVLGAIALLVRYGPTESRPQLEDWLTKYSAEVGTAIREAGDRFDQAAGRVLDHKLSVPEGILEELNRMSTEEIRETYSLSEIEDEFAGFLEQAAFAMEGLKLLRLGHRFRSFASRLEGLRGSWAYVVPKVAAAFAGDWNPGRMGLLTSAPPELWWDRDLAAEVVKHRH